MTFCDMLRHTVAKNHINAPNVKSDTLGSSIWPFMSRCIKEKNHINAVIAKKRFLDAVISLFMNGVTLAKNLTNARNVESSLNPILI